jgi:hypothetical protein
MLLSRQNESFSCGERPPEGAVCRPLALHFLFNIVHILFGPQLSSPSTDFITLWKSINNSIFCLFPVRCLEKLHQILCKLKTFPLFFSPTEDFLPLGVPVNIRSTAILLLFFSPHFLYWVLLMLPEVFLINM